MLSYTSSRPQFAWAAQARSVRLRQPAGLIDGRPGAWAGRRGGFGDDVLHADQAVDVVEWCPFEAARGGASPAPRCWGALLGPFRRLCRSRPPGAARRGPGRRPWQLWHGL